MKKAEMCLKIAENMDKKQHCEHIPVKVMADFINEHYSLKQVKEMFIESMGL